MNFLEKVRKILQQLDDGLVTEDEAINQIKNSVFFSNELIELLYNLHKE